MMPIAIGSSYLRLSFTKLLVLFVNVSILADNKEDG